MGEAVEVLEVSVSLGGKPATSKFRQFREGNLNRFYTRHAIGDILASQLTHLSPKSVLDLGSGEGSLSASVGKLWNKIKIVTVDVDPESAAGMHENILSSGASNHVHFVHDVFDPAMASKVSSEGTFDLAVCNPPFFKPQWKEEFAAILAQGDLIDACPAKADLSAEILFLAQNLALLKKGGTVAMILPDGLLTGWKTKALRQSLLAKHRLDCVMQLPKHSFHDTEARCFILFLTKNTKPAKQIKLLRFDADKGLLDPIYVSPREAEKRMDFDYHWQSSQHDQGLISLGQLKAEIKRGSISTVAAKQAAFPIFHTSDFGKAKDGELSFLNTQSANGIVIAEPGDIVMARVDRNLHQKIALVTSGRVALTDCVYRIRLAPEYQKAAFQALRSAEGSTKIQAASKGVGARLIGKADLLDIPLVLGTEISFFSEELF